MIVGDLVKQTQENLDQVGMNYGIGVVMEINNSSAGIPLAIVWWPKLIPQRSMRIRASKIEVLRTTYCTSCISRRWGNMHIFK